MPQESQNSAYTVIISENEAGQRLDNYLIKQLKGVPKGHLYRIVRKGEVRVNKKRSKVQQRLQQGDQVRIPPVRISQRERIVPGETRQAELLECVIFEDAHLLVLNKPARWSVHGGSGTDYGIIETLRLAREHSPYLELVHRLDKDTSGCLMVAKSRTCLLALQTMLSQHQGHILKQYLALVKGRWDLGKIKLDTGYALAVSGSKSKSAKVTESGKTAQSFFMPHRVFNLSSLIKINITTGRMHQIRVHAAHLDHPVAGDSKYGDFEFNRQMKKHYNLKRIFLHAGQLKFRHPMTQADLEINAPLPDELRSVITALNAS